MSDDLVKRETELGLAYQNGWLDGQKKAKERIEELEKERDRYLRHLTAGAKGLNEYKARIEELEAKLAKAVEFTKGVIRHAGNSGDDYLAEQARTTLAELEGQDDE